MTDVKWTGSCTVCKSNTFTVHYCNVYLFPGKKQKDDVEMRQPLVETFPPGNDMSQKNCLYYKEQKWLHFSLTSEEDWIDFSDVANKKKSSNMKLDMFI